MSMIDSIIPFDIKCKRVHLRQKTAGNVFLGASRKVSFSYFFRIMAAASSASCIFKITKNTQCVNYI